MVFVCIYPGAINSLPPISFLELVGTKLVMFYICDITGAPNILLNLSDTAIAVDLTALEFQWLPGIPSNSKR